MSLLCVVSLAFAPFTSARAEVKPETGKHYTVSLLAGQSNMDGRAKTKDLTGELAAFIARIRTDLKQPDMPFVIGEVCPANPQY